jgi:AcrR family transcriptional regulator
LIERSTNFNYDKGLVISENFLSKLKPPCRPCADKTRLSILKAAQKLFVKKGFAATSISEIADLASINQSLIYHHFKDKKELWIKVKSQIICEHWEIHPIKTLEELSEKDLLTFLTHVVKQRFSVYLKNPDIVRIINWQRLEPNYGELHEGPYASPQKWIDSIEKLQVRGEIRKELCPEWVLFFITNSILCIFIDHIALPKQKRKPITEKYIPMIISCLHRALCQQGILD